MTKIYNFSDYKIYAKCMFQGHKIDFVVNPGGSKICIC